MFQSASVYEICFRARRGLPLPARRLIKLVIDSALARTQRDGGKVIICNYVWMANHVHMLVVSQDIAELKNFYGELKKRITDILKRLLGLEELYLWENKEARVIRVLDLDKLKRQLAYYFLNPVRAGLVDSIEHYPGESTWKAFCSVEPRVDAALESSAPWIRLPSIPALASARPTVGEETRIINEIKSRNKKQHFLKVLPLACFKVFGITDAEDLETQRSKVIEMVRNEEAALREQRTKKRLSVLGAVRMLLEPITTEGYKPAKNGRIVYFLSSIKELRIEFYERYQAFCRNCRECYRRACRGDSNVEWPPGAFLPPIPPRFNPLEFAAA